MASCEICGSPVDARRNTRKYCSGKCRKRASRAMKKAADRARELTMTLEGAAMLQKLRKLLPRTAASVEKFIEANGAGCAEAAVRLVLVAYSEAGGAV